MDRRHLPFWILTGAFAAGLMLPRLVSEGMFMDGLLYAVVARNLAAGVGTFWKPHCTNSLFPEFYEHPPVGLNLQSLFFRAFGDATTVESIYTLVTAVATAAMIVVVWRALTGQRRMHRDLAALSWLPVFLWLGIPQVPWAYVNNLLENTMGVFTLLAVYLAIRGVQSGAVGPAVHEGRAAARAGQAARARSRRAWVHTAAAGAAVCLAVLTKGPAGFFPLAAAPCYWVATRRVTFARALAHTALLVLVTAAIIALLMLFEDARYNIQRYVDTQLRPSLSGARGGGAFSPQIVTKLLAEIGPPLGVTAIVLFVGWRRQVLGVIDDVSRRAALLMLLIGLCGSLSIIVSPRQSGFYLLPSLPFFALSLALVAAPVLERWIARIAPASRPARILAIVSWAILLGVLVYGGSKFGTVGRDQRMIADVKAIAQHVSAARRSPDRPPGSGAPDDTDVGICPDLYGHWSLHGYMARYFNISLDPSPEGRDFLLVQDNCREFDLSGYARVLLDTHAYQLYRRIAPTAPR